MSRCKACNRMIDIFDKNRLLELPTNKDILEALYDIDEEVLEELYSERPHEEEDLCSHCRTDIIKSVLYSRSYEHEDLVNDPLHEIFNR